jgi:uncharacterized membrane protein YccC
MTTSSVSFRITRHAEDLAQTIHALSQRVVQLEQRLALMENHLSTSEEEEELPAEHLTSLANVDQLLRDCRELLAADPIPAAAASIAAPPAAGFATSGGDDPLDAFAEAA